MEIRDPIHGLVEYDDLEEAVMNSSAFQRLRRIRQLALASYVYPGALHTRFEHSIGAMHLAGRMGQQVGLAPNAVGVVRLAGLLHDVGHGPFSHVSDGPLAQLSRTYASAEGISPGKIHECITSDIIRLLPKSIRSLSRSVAEQVAELVDPRSGGKGKPTSDGLLGAIVSGPLDADKMDYLIRDSYFAGVKYGVFDVDRMIRALAPIEDPGHRRYLAVKEEDIHAVEQYLLAKYHITAQVYRHRVRRMTDLLLQRMVLTAIEEGVTQVRDLYSYSGPDDGFVDRYLSHDDNSLWALIASCRKALRATRLLEVVRQRHLPKCVFSQNLSDAFPPFARNTLHDGEKGSNVLKEMELSVSNKCSIDRDLVFVDLVSANLPEPTALEPSLDVEEINVLAGNEVKLFGTVSDFFQSNPLLKHELLCVYVPVDASTKNEARKQAARLGRIVKKILHERLGGEKQ